MIVVALKIVLVILFIIACMAVGPAILMLVWNAVVADMFNGPEITFWVAFGIIVVLNIIAGILRGSKK